MTDYAYINPDMLKWARETSGLDFVAAAKKIGVSRDRLAEFEDGAELPTLRQMNEICRVYKRPLSAFYLRERPQGFSVARAFRSGTGEKLGDMSPELIAALRSLMERRDVALDLFPDAGGEKITRYIGTLSASRNAGSIAQAIREVLQVSEARVRQWKDEYQALAGWSEAIQDAGVMVVHFEKVAVREARGVCIREKVLPVIGLNGSDAPLARVFTLIHEFAHLLLSSGTSHAVTSAIDMQEPVGRVERLCNQAAAELLMPSSLVIELVGGIPARPTDAISEEAVAQAARHIWVSRKAFAIRLRELGYVTEARCDALLKAFTREGRKKPGPVSQAGLAIRRVGRRLSGLALAAYASDRITGPVLADFFGARLKHLPEIASRLAGRTLLTGEDA